MVDLRAFIEHEGSDHMILWISQLVQRGASYLGLRIKHYEVGIDGEWHRLILILFQLCYQQRMSAFFKLCTHSCEFQNKL